MQMEELEGRFEISRRIIFRALKFLIEGEVKMGNNTNKGSYMVDGYHLPPVAFNMEDAAAILIGAKPNKKMQSPA
ncbi:MAG: putative DNA-binding transcriptional regulator YafY [Cyclobacteriaceae bacterium]|jgi:predicted DNA-binding transcriptional regulator YafY